jgi:hypothetical protein
MGRDEDTLPNVGGGVMFDEADAAGDFKNQLMLPPAAATVTQQQVGKGITLPPTAQMWGGGQQPLPPPPPQQVGVGVHGGGQQAPGDVAYSGINSALHQLGHRMYDPATINTELSMQSGVNPGNVTSWTAFQDLVVIWPCSGGSHMSQ